MSARGVSSRFVTLELEAPSGSPATPPQLIQLSDSVPTIKRVCDVIALALSRKGGVPAGATLRYQDDEGDWVTVAADADVVEMMAVGKALGGPLKVRPPSVCVHKCFHVCVGVAVAFGLGLGTVVFWGWGAIGKCPSWLPCTHVHSCSVPTPASSVFFSVP